MIEKRGELYILPAPDDEAARTALALTWVVQPDTGDTKSVFGPYEVDLSTEVGVSQNTNVLPLDKAAATIVIMGRLAREDHGDEDLARKAAEELVEVARNRRAFSDIVHQLVVNQLAACVEHSSVRRTEAP